MPTSRLILQPDGGRTHASEMVALLAEPGIAHLDLAVAYVTNSGVTTLLSLLQRDAKATEAWPGLKKRFLVGIDWYRSEPTALERLAALPEAEVRVHDGLRVLGKDRCTPITPWHPKAAFVSGPGVHAALIGSGNLSRSGLQRGFEVGSVQLIRSRGVASADPMWTELMTGQQWFQTQWGAATKLASILDEYKEKYSDEAIQRAAPTEDDGDPSGDLTKRRRGMTPETIAALRISQNFWIWSGNITKNRGQARPGDQLMMSALTRVFFGRAPDKVDTNTALGDVAIRHPSQDLVVQRPLRFSDNSMDVLTLPVPEDPWPDSYDQQCIWFTKVARGPRLEYKMQVGGAALRRRLRRLSNSQGTAFTMTSGREWGIFG